MGNTVDKTRKKKLYSAFRAYCFINFAFLGLIALCVGLTQIGEDAVFGIGLLVMGLIGLGIAYLFWLPVTKRVQPADRKAVFWNFCLTGFLTFAKGLLICTLILIPLAIRIADNRYEELVITSGVNAGETILVRHAGGNEYRDVNGNIYRTR